MMINGLRTESVKMVTEKTNCKTAAHPGPDADSRSQFAFRGLRVDGLGLDGSSNKSILKMHRLVMFLLSYHDYFSLSLYLRGAS